MRQVDKEENGAEDGLHEMYEVMMPYAWVRVASRGLKIMVACFCQVLARLCMYNTEPAAVDLLRSDTKNLAGHHMSEEFSIEQILRLMSRVYRLNSIAKLKEGS